MEPLKPETKKQILESRPQAAPEDIEEYERLLSQRFAVDPHVPVATPAAPVSAAPKGAKIAAEAIASAAVQREVRLAELHQKLFGTSKAKKKSAKRKRK